MPVIAHRKPYNAAQRASHTQCRRGSRDAELMHLVLQPCGTHLQLGEHAPKRPALPDPPHPQVALQIREPQLGQAGLPLGRPQRSLPRDRSARPDGCPAAWQPMLVEPVTHRGGVHAKLAGDAGGWPSPDHPPVGQVVLQWWEAQLRRPGGELLVGGGAPGVGGGHPAGRRGDARLVEQVADDLGGGGGGGGGVIHAPGVPGGTTIGKHLDQQERAPWCRSVVTAYWPCSATTSRNARSGHLPAHGCRGTPKAWVTGPSCSVGGAWRSRTLTWWSKQRRCCDGSINARARWSCRALGSAASCRARGGRGRKVRKRTPARHVQLTTRRGLSVLTGLGQGSLAPREARATLEDSGLDGSYGHRPVGHDTDG